MQQDIKKDFKSKEEIFKYIKNNFSDKNDLILIRGSTAKGGIREFSDFDIEIYSKIKKKPFYEIIFYNNLPVLLTIYFYEYETGNKIEVPKDILVLQGNYNDKIENIFQKEFGKVDEYSKDELINRKCQLIMDFFFKYMRSGDEKYLGFVQKRLKFES